MPGPELGLPIPPAAKPLKEEGLEARSTKGGSAGNWGRPWRNIPLPFREKRAPALSGMAAGGFHAMSSAGGGRAGLWELAAVSQRRRPKGAAMAEEEEE